MKGCQYCSKVINTPLIYSNESSGIKVTIKYYKDKKYGKLSTFGWYDNCVGIEGQDININFCPMCGRKLNEEGQGML